MTTVGPFLQPLKPSMGRLPVLHQVSPKLDFMGHKSTSVRYHRNLETGESAEGKEKHKKFQENHPLNNILTQAGKSGLEEDTFRLSALSPI